MAEALAPGSLTLLHVGCGRQTRKQLTKGFHSDQWREIRLDIDPGVEPDVIGTITDLSAIPSESVDALYSSHNLEHVFHHEVPAVLQAFHRVLKPGGFVVLTCPDLQSVCAAVAEGRLLEPLFTARSGPISAMDILYGHGDKLAQGKLYMAHKCGFTYATLCRHFEEAGFRSHIGAARPFAFDLWILAFKSDAEIPQGTMQAEAAKYLP